MTQKKLYITALSVFTLLLAVLMFFIGYRIDSSSLAQSKLSNEITVLEKSMESLAERKDEIQEQIDSLGEDLSTKDTANNYYMEYKKTYDDLTNEITSLEAELAQLNADIAEKQDQIDAINGVKKEKEGKKYALTKDNTYTCPDEVPEGRYKATGNGTIIISTSTGKNLKTENLDVAFENSYTFNLEKTQRIKVTGNVTLTELTAQ